MEGVRRDGAAGLDRIEAPAHVAVQASACAPHVRAFRAGEEHAERWEDAATWRRASAYPKAVGDFLILRAVRESGGARWRGATRRS